MRFQMGQSVFALKRGSLGDRFRKRVLWHVSGTEQLLHRALGIDQPFAYRARFSLVGVHQHLDGVTLLGAESKLVRKLERMRRPGKAVELGRFGESHAGARQVLLYFIGAESLDFTLVLARVRLVLRRRRECERHEDCSRDAPHGVTLTLPTMPASKWPGMRQP